MKNLVAERTRSNDPLYEDRLDLLMRTLVPRSNSDRTWLLSSTGISPGDIRNIIDKGRSQATTRDVFQTLGLLVLDEKEDTCQEPRDLFSRVPISTLVGCPVGLFFCNTRDLNCKTVASEVLDIYEQVRGDHPNFEIVMMPLEEQDPCNSYAPYYEWFAEFPFLSIPPDEGRVSYRALRDIGAYQVPSLIILDLDGKVETRFGLGAMKKLGAQAFPWTDFHPLRHWFWSLKEKCC